MDTVCSAFASLEAPSLYSISLDSPGAMSTNPEPTLVRVTPVSNSSILRRIASSASALSPLHILMLQLFQHIRFLLSASLWYIKNTIYSWFLLSSNSYSFIIKSNPIFGISISSYVKCVFFFIFIFYCNRKSGESPAIVSSPALHHHHPRISRAISVRLLKLHNLLGFSVTVTVNSIISVISPALT